MLNFKPHSIVKVIDYITSGMLSVKRHVYEISYFLTELTGAVVWQAAPLGANRAKTQFSMAPQPTDWLQGRKPTDVQSSLAAPREVCIGGMILVIIESSDYLYCTLQQMAGLSFSPLAR